MLRSLLWPVLAVALCAPLWGCDVNPFCIDCATGVSDDSGTKPPDAAVPDAEPVVIVDSGPDTDACVPTGTFEECNNLDDDCDGEVDNDPVMVGQACGTDVGPCEAGTYECIDGQLICGGGAVLATAEQCNGIDDDCDGDPDDGDPGGGVVCGDDTGECQRGITACLGGQVICSGEVLPTTELCDIKDNDCDGEIDEGNPEGGTACGNMTGECQPGTEQCIGGGLVCVGGEAASFEICDGADNDCDDEIDEDFDFNNDPNRCGDCTTVCDTPNAQPGCTLGECVVAFCFTGYWDLNGDPADGCEYACEFAGGEVCNGRDDDCNDEIDEGLTPPAMCSTIGECNGTTATCSGVGGWTCNYDSTVSTDASGALIPEADCDGLDNDCDGVPDDAFPTLGDACSKGIGACMTTGTMVCNGADTGVECSAATPPVGDPEICDGLDNNCDGIPDNGAPDDWVQVNGSLWVYAYEASRPDATDSAPGSMSHRPCSGANRLPWTNITQPEAEAQCALVGGDLCTEAEWLQICHSTSGSCAWAYGSDCSTYTPNACNGNDYDFDTGTAGDQDGLLPGGTLTACYSDWGDVARRAFDMSGNVKEWAKERSAGVNPLRGGSYNNSAAGISCDFDFAVGSDEFQFQNVGFRCCRHTAPPPPP